MVTKRGSLSALEWVLFAVLVVVLLSMVILDVLNPRRYESDEIGRVVVHLPVYVALGLSSVLVSRRAGGSWFPVALMLGCLSTVLYLVFAYREFVAFVQALVPGPVSPSFTRPFLERVVPQGAIAVGIASLGAMLLIQRRRKTAEPGATDNPGDAQRLREDH